MCDQDIIALLRAKLSRHPGVRYRATDDEVTLDPARPDGFEVRVVREDRHIRVFYAGWSDTFESATEAMDCFDFAFSDRCRLRVASRGGVDYAWRLEYYLDDAWHSDSSVQLPGPPPSGESAIRVLRNGPKRPE